MKDPLGGSDSIQRKKTYSRAGEELIGNRAGVGGGRGERPSSSRMQGMLAFSSQLPEKWQSREEAVTSNQQARPPHVLYPV